eukprot:9259166-Pyramimonas_sp.AAC.1
MVHLESTTVRAKRGASASRDPPRLDGGGSLRWGAPPPCPGPTTRSSELSNLEPGGGAGERPGGGAIGLLRS